MRFLADESCDFAVVRALRSVGHDVIAVSEISPRLPDPDVARLARSENRVLLTEDKDFGQLVYAGSPASVGVIFFRFPSKVRGSLAGAAVQLVAQKGESLGKHFVVVQPGRVRISALPTDDR